MPNAPAKQEKAADAIPAFERDFDSFLSYLNHGAGRAVISPKRFAQVFSFDLKSLAAAAHVHRNTVTRFRAIGLPGTWGKKYRSV